MIISESKKGSQECACYLVSISNQSLNIPKYESIKSDSLIMGLLMEIWTDCKEGLMSIMTFDWVKSFQASYV